MGLVSPAFGLGGCTLGQHLESASKSAALASSRKRQTRRGAVLKRLSQYKTQP